MEHHRTAKRLNYRRNSSSEPHKPQKSSTTASSRTAKRSAVVGLKGLWGKGKSLSYQTFTSRAGTQNFSNSSGAPCMSQFRKYIFAALHRAGNFRDDIAVGLPNRTAICSVGQMLSRDFKASPVVEIAWHGNYSFKSNACDLILFPAAKCTKYKVALEQNDKN